MSFITNCQVHCYLSVGKIFQLIRLLCSQIFLISFLNLPAGVPQWYSEPRIQLLLLVRNFPSIFSVPVEYIPCRKFKQVNVFLFEFFRVRCYRKHNIFSVPAEYNQCRKYKQITVGILVIERNPSISEYLNFKHMLFHPFRSVLLDGSFLHF